MNTKKHKHKKANKPPNLNNLQTDENKMECIIDSQTTNIECENKVECVQDKVSEAVNKEEEKEIEILTPKKPKRNKGKKKKLEKESEMAQNKESEPTKGETLDIALSEKVHTDLPEVILVARKKKNKIKGVLQNEKAPEDKLDSIQLQEEIKSAIIGINTSLAKIESIEEDKIVKKKNKKKKTHSDAEKSDKSGEVTSCTSVFQNVLVAEENKLNSELYKPNTKEICEENNNLLNTSHISTDIKTVECLQSFESGTLVIENKNEIKETQESLTLQSCENESKKEIKQSSKTISVDEDKFNDSQNQLSLKNSKVVPEADELLGSSSEKCKPSRHNENITKLKGKIGKPVEKKRKEKEKFQKQCSTTLDETENKKYTTGDTFENFFIVSPVQEEIKHEENDKNQDILNKSQQSAAIVQEISQYIQIKDKEEQLKISDTSETIIDTKANIIESNQDIAEDELIFETLVPSDFGSKSSEDKLNEILNTITEPTENNQNIKFVTTDSNQLLEKNRKSKKKIKITPKILIHPIPSKSNAKLIKAKEKLTANEIDDKSSILTPTDEIEIRSVKADESEGSACDMTPEVIHLRSASEHLIDDNNNTVIREVFEDTLNTLLLCENIPLIQGSGETPTSTPETISAEIKLAKIDNISTKIEEKTDIKSKIMEVNKDMEELKSSIEKSLAEFKVLENSDAICKDQLLERNQDLKIDDKYKQETSDVKTEYLIYEDILKTSKSQNENIEFVETVPIFSQQICTDEHSTEKSLVDVGCQLKVKEYAEIDTKSDENKVDIEQTKQDMTDNVDTPPICPARRDHKKGKNKRGKQGASLAINIPQSSQISATPTQDTNKNEKSQQNTETSEEKSKQQSSTHKDENIKPYEEDNHTNEFNLNEEANYEPIDNFEDALTSSADDINKTFEIIVNQITENSQQELASAKPEINIIAPIEDSEQKDVKENRITPPKNLLGHPNIPARSNKFDYKKEKDKLPNTRQAKVKIKDDFQIENNKTSKESQTEKKKHENNLKNQESFSQVSNCDDFIYKYSFRKVFLQSACHICKKELIQFRVPCKFCSLIFYCSIKHKDEDWPQHQALCFAVSTIVHIKDQKHIYADVKNITGNNYRLLRMQTILSCEKVLKRRLIPWEQEVLLYPRICADVTCREWKQSKLKDCDGCRQISYCSANADHLPKSHQRWCKSYFLYHKLVTYQQTKGRLEPKLPSKVLKEYQIPEKINEVLVFMFEEKIDLNDVQYAALTQIATAPLTVAFCHQMYRSIKFKNEMNKASTFTIHVVGAELQFEADVLNKWEIFLLHLRPDVQKLKVVLISPDLNPGKLPLDLLGRIKLCENCHQNKRRVTFDFQDKKTYQEYQNSDDFIYPDIVCAFNTSIHRSSVYSKDPWPSTITAVLKLKSPFVITSHTITELHRDLVRVKECSELEVIVEPRSNPFSSVRPDRNFISDDEVPLIFKNHCFMMLSGF